MSDFEWGGGEVDLDAYLSRIGFQGAGEPNADTLRSVHRAHVAAIPFENLDVVLGRPIRLDIEALQDKLVRKRRGGYCFEQNLLLAAVLERIGFTFTALGARVRMDSGQVRPVTHMLLRVEADGQEWLADVGFGGEGLLEPIPLQDGIQSRQGDWTFGLELEQKGVRALRSLHHDGWFDLYGFTLEERFPVDYVVMNHYISTHPRSPFTGKPVVQQMEPGVRRSLVGPRLSTMRPDGSLGERELSADELPEVLVCDFGLELTEEEVDHLRRWRSERS